MACVKRETYTRPLPEDAEIITRKGQRLAKWTDKRTGKARTAPLNGGSTRIVLRAPAHTAKFRDAAGRVEDRATHCREKVASLTVAHLVLDDEHPCVQLRVADEKSAKGSTLPLRADLVAELRQWLADKLRRLQEEAKAAGKPVPDELPPDTRVFCVPHGLLRILDRDLAAAGIAKKDGRGRTVDVHALRHSFCSHLSKGGVAPRTAQAAMRHSTLELTMSHYTDESLLDVEGALDVPPDLPIAGPPTTAPDPLPAPFLAPESDVSSRELLLPDVLTTGGLRPGDLVDGHEKADSPANSQENRPMTLVEIAGLEPAPSDLSGRRGRVAWPLRRFCRDCQSRMLASLRTGSRLRRESRSAPTHGASATAWWIPAAVSCAARHLQGAFRPFSLLTAGSFV